MTRIRGLTRSVASFGDSEDAGEAVADILDLKVAGLIGRKLDDRRFPRDSLLENSTQGRILIRLMCSRTCVVTKSLTGSPFFTISGSGENSPG